MPIHLQQDAQILPQRDDNSTTSSIFRPIHYLGSKLRVVTQIQNIIESLAPEGSTICDIFSGSGTVSHYLASNYNVIANDIQEYSRVINSGLLCSELNDEKIAKLQEIIPKAKSSQIYDSLTSIFSNLVFLEKESIQLAENGNPFPLCDLIEHGSIICSELSKPSRNKLSEELFNCHTKISNNPLALHHSLISTYFGGVYFSYTQAIQFDAIKSQIKLLPLELQDLGNTVILNVMSELVNTVGKQFAQPLRPRDKNGEPKKNLYKTIKKDREKDVFSYYESALTLALKNIKYRKGNKSIKGDFKDISIHYKNDISVIYADPPYTRDHYSRFYHVLETCCLYDFPKISMAKKNGLIIPSRGIYREDRHQSPFCIRSQAKTAFHSLFELSNHYQASLLISYSPFENDSGSHPRVLSIDDIADIGKNFSKKIDIISAGELKHSKLNRSDLHLPATSLAETFIIVR
ncbi:DNA adenine methylase [Aeromonas veronii]|uniref:DNA adenine methylase n=1 Tax=Aeromonas veronii TaxID=654 RepID=UPI003A4A58FE